MINRFTFGRLALVAAGAIAAAAAVAGWIALVGTTSRLTSLWSLGPLRTQPITWNALPSPVVVHPGWTSFTNVDSINALLVHDQLVWAATDGGALAWSLETGAHAKWTAEHGLASNRVTSLTASADGALWLGTAGGVSRYDGQTWRTYTVRDGLPSDDVRHVASAPVLGGSIWAGTAGGIGRFDGRRWRAYTVLNTGGDIGSNDVRALALVPGGAWAATANGVSLFDGREWQHFGTQDGLSHNDVRAVAVAPDGALWAATAGGLSRFDGARWQRFTTADGLASDDLRALSVGGDGAVWVGYGDAAAGLTRHDAQGGWQTLTPDGLPNLTVYALAGDRASGLWVGTAQGVAHFDGANWRSLSAPSEIPAGDARRLLWARGALWLATESGVSRFDGVRWRHFDAGDGLPALPVSALAAGPDESVWAAFERPESGLSRFDGQLWQPVPCVSSRPASLNVPSAAVGPDGSIWFATDRGVSRYRRGQWSSTTVADGLPSDDVRAVTLSSSGDVWASTAYGLAKLEDERWRLIAEGDVRSLAAGTDGDIWALLSPGGLIHATEEGVATVALLAGQSQPHALAVAADGVWLATASGLARFDGTAWRTFTIGEGLTSSDVGALAVAPNGELWAAFSDPALGFARYTGGRDGRWRTLESSVLAQGWMRGRVQTLAIARDGSFWAATSTGSGRRFDPRESRSSYFSLLPDRHEIRSIVQATDGTLWIGTLGSGVIRLPSTAAWGERETFVPDPVVSGEPVQDLAVSADGSAWLATPAGVVHVSGAKCELDERLRRRVNVLAALVNADGELWFGTHFDGAMHWEADDPEAVWFAAEWTGRPVQALALDADGSTWFVSNQAVSRYREGEWQQFPFDSGVDGGSLSITAATTRGVWVGTRQGVLHFNGREWQALTSADGLADNTASAVLAAPDGSLWVATPGGVSQYRP